MTDCCGKLVRLAWRTGLDVTYGVALRVVRGATKVLRDSSAITSLEFALVFFPFFSLIFGTFTVGLWYFYTSGLDLGVYLAGRALMTGQFQATASATTTSSANFTTGILCPQMPAMLPCSATNPIVNISVVSDFTQLVKETQVPIPNTSPQQYWTKLTLLPLPNNFCSPKEGDIVYIQALYSLPNIFGFFGVFHPVVMSGTTVQIEQFPNTGTVNTNC